MFQLWDRSAKRTGTAILRIVTVWQDFAPVLWSITRTLGMMAVFLVLVYNSVFYVPVSSLSIFTETRKNWAMHSKCESEVKYKWFAYLYRAGWQVREWLRVCHRKFEVHGCLHMQSGSITWSRVTANDVWKRPIPWANTVKRTLSVSCFWITSSVGLMANVLAWKTSINVAPCVFRILVRIIE